MTGALELWGGLECTVVRLNDAWRDQVRETGHHDRDGDLAQVAALGIRTLRYPILWERCDVLQPGAAEGGWAWHDRRVAEMQRLGITPIGGLLHHGMGPLPGGLLDAGFADGLAAHATAAARRYPAITTWTPVNEPLTTARFACLYGTWHPHLRDEGSFLRALVAECRAAQLAMRAIRAVTPHARFIHTEDLGRTFAVTRLHAQALYENDRRWLSLDLLCGRLDGSHPWRGWLERHGVTPRDLDELVTGEATPDIVGINHYVTSDRYLDTDLRAYPPHLRGGRPGQRYVDTEAARAHLPPGSTGWLPRLREAWERYRLPIAVTEAHLGCDDPAEQVCWLMEAWSAAQALRAQGADIRAVTAWALMGLVDWNTMLRERRGHYEPGAFDVRSDPPRLTQLGEAVGRLARTGVVDATPRDGWWQREDRMHRRPRGLG